MSYRRNTGQRDALQEEHRAEGLEGCRTEWKQAWSDAGQEDAGQVGCRTAGLQ